MKRSGNGRRRRGWRGGLVMAGLAVVLLAGGAGGRLEEGLRWAAGLAEAEQVLGLRLSTGAVQGSAQVLAASPALALMMQEDWEEEPISQGAVDDPVVLAEEETLEPGEQPAEESAAPTESPEEPAAEGDTSAVAETTLVSAGGTGGSTLDGVALNDSAQLGVSLAEIAQLNTQVDLSQTGPQILIMHTHGTEAYTPAGADSYTPSDSYRTTDQDYNMLRVGEEIAAALEEAGYSVLHDTTLYDYPSYTGSYARARTGIQSYLDSYPTISLVIDVHRDALIADDGTAYKVVTTVSGEKTAQVMLVMGSDAGGLEHPNWKGNLSFAIQVQRQLLAVDTTLPRPINLRASRFNQDMTAGSLLVEVGSCGNTLEEALRGGRLFAQALAAALAEQ